MLRHPTHWMSLNCRCSGLHDFSVPENGTMIRLGTAQSVINTLVAHVSPQFLDISVPPPGPRGQARAENMEKFLTGAHHMIEHRSPVYRELWSLSPTSGVTFQSLHRTWKKTKLIVNVCKKLSRSDLSLGLSSQLP
jgi:hypothetical protein